MKKILFFAAFAALLSLASCQKQITPASGTEDNIVSTVKSPVFTASINQGTKTTLDLADGKLVWERTDEITVTDASSASAVYTIENIDTTTGKATFVIKEGEAGLGEGPYTAIYGTEPATAQTYSATAGKLYMTAPETSDNNFTFTVQCGLMKINLTKAGENIKSITVTGTTTIGSKMTFTLTCDPAESIASAKDFCIALPEGSYTKIVLTDSNGKVCTLNSTSGVTVAANHIKPVTLIEDKIKFTSSSLTTTPKHEIWGGHAKFHANIDESEYPDPSAIKFAYCAAATSDWKTVDAVRESEGSYVAEVKELECGTEYLYNLMIGGKEIGNSMALTTEPGPQLPNYNFETVSHDESNKYHSFYDPASSKSELKTKFWDSGNFAFARYGYVTCSSSTGMSGIGSVSCVLLESAYVVIYFTGGNFFTGECFGFDGNERKMNFGRPFTARPTGVRFWYCYSAGKVTTIASGCPLTTDDYDSFNIQVALGTWRESKYGGSSDSPIQVNTGNKSTFYKYEELPETIAYGEYEEIGNGSKSSWNLCEIEIKYKDLTTWPTHIIVSCASSKYGDYHAGCRDAKLWIDDFELVYE